MQNENQDFYNQVNHARYHGQTHGHYESFFLRANHPARPLASDPPPLFSPKPARKRWASLGLSSST
jgi:hypothetical protein